jgi:hypothetical protein
VLGRTLLATKLQVGVTGVDSSLASRNGTIQPVVENGRTVGGGFMSNVLSLQGARERAWQPRAGSNGHAFKELGQSVWKSKTTEREGRTASNQRLLERLEAENAQLRESVVELTLQILALRDRARTLTA